MLLGIYKNFEELELNLTLGELTAILKADRERRYEEFKFAASLKGINLDDQGPQGDSKTQFERIKARAEARANNDNRSAEAIDLEFFGISYEQE